MEIRRGSPSSFGSLALIQRSRQYKERRCQQKRGYPAQHCNPPQLPHLPFKLSGIDRNLMAVDQIIVLHVIHPEKKRTAALVLDLPKAHHTLVRVDAGANLGA